MVFQDRWSLIKSRIKWEELDIGCHKVSLSRADGLSLEASLKLGTYHCTCKRWRKIHITWPSPESSEDILHMAHASSASCLPSLGLYTPVICNENHSLSEAVTYIMAPSLMCVFTLQQLRIGSTSNDKSEYLSFIANLCFFFLLIRVISFIQRFQDVQA